MVYLGVTDGIKLKFEMACKFGGRKCQQKIDSIERKDGIRYDSDKFRENAI